MKRVEQTETARNAGAYPTDQKVSGSTPDGCAIQIKKSLDGRMFHYGHLVTALVTVPLGNSMFGLGATSSNIGQHCHLTFDQMHWTCPATSCFSLPGFSLLGEYSYLFVRHGAVKQQDPLASNSSHRWDGQIPPPNTDGTRLRVSLASKAFVLRLL